MKAPFGTRKVLGKEKKNVKGNYFLMFGSTVENVEENQISTKNEIVCILVVDLKRDT